MKEASLESIEFAIRSVDTLLGDSNYPDWQRVREALLMFAAFLKDEPPGTPCAFSPWLARFVVDSWPLGSDTTAAVVAAEREFMEHLQRSNRH